ncbi:MAG TPA: hypothetical protein VKS79_15080 [Gemmataceae bacterium]|nr:hypothetical protein [Gemmataceae bacterium]
MKILIRGAAALSVALAMASLGWSQYPQPVPAPNQTQASAGGCGYAAPMEAGAPAKHGLLGHFGIHCHPLPYHPAEPHGHGGHGFGGGYGDPYGHGNGFGGGNGLFGQYDHSPFPTSQAGTVVFPQHPFARSPRDYFMAD